MLSCLDTVSYPPFDLSWAAYDGSNGEVNIDNKLHLLNIQADETYTCFMFNPVTSFTIRYKVPLTVTDTVVTPPPTILTAPSDIVADVGDDVEFYCVAGGS